MAARLRDLGVDSDTVEKVTVFDERFDYYLTVNRQTPDTLINRLQNALDKIRRSGSYQQLEDKYLR